MRGGLEIDAVILTPKALILNRNDQEADRDQDHENDREAAAAASEGVGLRRAEEIEVQAVSGEDSEVTFGPAETRAAVAVEN